MLTGKEIAEIEKRSNSSNTHERTTCMLMRFSDLLATVKELSESLKVCRKDKEDYCADLEYFRKKYDEQRELLRKCRHRIMHTNECETNEDELTCVCDACEIENQIEEVGK